MGQGVGIDELRALARAVALDGALVVEWGAPGQGWCLDTGTGAIRCDPHDAAHEHPDEARGLVCHEAAHAAVTRYPHLVPPAVLRGPGMAALMNALEDCRIETWLAERFPGAAAWIQRYNQRLFPVSFEGLAQRPRIHQFCIGAIHGWWHGALPEGLSPEVVEALAATADARRAVIGLQPPVDVVDADAPQYAGSAVAHRFEAMDAAHPPDGFERAVRWSAWQAWRVVWKDVRPAYEELLRRDLAEHRSLDEQERRFLQQLRGLTLPIPLHSAQRGAVGRGEGSAAFDGADVPPALRRALEQVVHAEPADVYEAARRTVAPLVERMARSLEPLMRRQAVPRWVPGWRTGARVDLRAVMQGVADPRRRDRVWQRKTLPHKHDPAVMLLLDLSGSMEGPGIENGFLGVVLLCEVLERMRVPFAVEGFQDARIAFKDLSVPLDATVRTLLGGMPEEVRGRRPGGRNRPQHNWDGPAVSGAAASLAAWPVSHRLLVVVSDGRPTGPGDPERSLAEAVGAVLADGRVQLLAIGLGPGTEHVAEHYPSHLAAIALEDFPEALGRVLERELVPSL